MGLALAAPPPLDVDTLNRNCDAGRASSCALLAIRYRHGRGLQHDPAKAYAYARKGCDAGSDFACGYAGDMLYLGLGTDENRPEGERLMRAACQKGDRWSCDTLRDHGLPTTSAEPASVSAQ